MRGSRSPRSEDLGIAPWRFVAGAVLHLGIVGYLVLIPLATLLLTPSGSGPADHASTALRYTGYYLAGLLIVGTLATIVAAAVGHSGRTLGIESDDRVASEHRLRAIANASARLDPPEAAIVADLAGRRWHHDDTRYQSLSHDLDLLLRVAIAGLETVEVKDRARIAKQTRSWLELLRQTAIELEEEYAARVEDELHTARRFIEGRHRRSDFPVGPD